MNNNKPGFECPVCWRAIEETRYGHCIQPHKDTAGNWCPASGRSMSIAIKTSGKDRPRR